MTSPSSSTAADSSEIGRRVQRALDENREVQVNKPTARMVRLKERIDALEARGFIKRQKFVAPTTADFERQMSRLLRDAR